MVVAIFNEFATECINLLKRIMPQKENDLWEEVNLRLYFPILPKSNTVDTCVDNFIDISLQQSQVHSSLSDMLPQCFRKCQIACFKGAFWHCFAIRGNRQRKNTHANISITPKKHVFVPQEWYKNT